MFQLDHQHQAIVNGDELARYHAELAGRPQPSSEESVVEAIAALLHFARSEFGPAAHYAVAQKAVIHVDSLCELASLAQAAGGGEGVLSGRG